MEALLLRVVVDVQKLVSLVLKLDPLSKLLSVRVFLMAKKRM